MSDHQRFPSAPPPHHPLQQLPPQEWEGMDADLFDYSKLRDYLQFTAGAVRRRKAVVFGTLCVVVGLSALALKVLPKTYHCEMKLQAQSNKVISTLAGFSRAWDWDQPTKAAQDLVLREENLVSLVRKTNLVKVWETHRAPALQVKDAIMSWLRPEWTPLEKEMALVGTLEQKLTVTPGDGWIVLGVDWGDAESAYRLTQAAHENFLEARQFQEVSAVSEAIALLENRARDAQSRVNEAVEAVQKSRANMKGAKQAAVAQARKVLERKSPAPLSPELVQLRGQLQGKQRAIAELEEFRRRRLNELQVKLAEQKQIYSEFHPAVIDLQQTIAQQERQEPPQLSSLREEYARLEEEYFRKGGPSLLAAEEQRAALGSLSAEALRIGAQSLSDELESPEVEQAKSELKFEMGKYTSLLEKIDSAKLELETQRAAFRYRYSVLRPASVPTSAAKPKAALVLIGGFVAGLLLGILAAVLADLRSGRLLERWQVERMLGLPILAEVKTR